MLYLRPTSRIAPAAAVKPIGSSEPVQQQLLAPYKPTNAPQLTMRMIERRKNHDRRHKTKNTLLETRTSKDRRKTNKPIISLSI